MKALPGRPTAKIKKVKDVVIKEKQPRSIYVQFIFEMEDDSEVRMTKRVFNRWIAYGNPYKSKIKEISSVKLTDKHYGNRGFLLEYVCEMEDGGEWRKNEENGYAQIEQKIRLKKRDIEVEVIPKEEVL